MREVAGAADPDSAPRTVTLPATWDDRAADALASLTPGTGNLSIAGASGVWLGILTQRARQAGQPDLPLALHALLRQRRAAPTANVWRGEPGPPGYLLNVAAFLTPGAGFEVRAFAEACNDAARACRLFAPEGPYEIALSGLDDLLAALGLPYASQAARDTAACLGALLRAQVALALESPQLDLLATGADWPLPPRSPVPGLAEAAQAARARARLTPGAPGATCLLPPGEVDALLGIETAGIAPAFGPVREGRLSRAALDRLASSQLSPEAALAASLTGSDPLPPASHEAHLAMHRALAPYLERMPAEPVALPAPSLPARTTIAPRARPLPARAQGLAQKVTVGGHRVFLRTGEYPDGALGEITIALPKEGATTRALIECLAQAVSIGLQHGVRLDAFVDAFTATDFGPAGQVEGDPAISQASSVLDYVFRTLAVNYLGRRLPEPVPETEMAGETAPLLPLDLPPRMRRRALRIVG